MQENVVQTLFYVLKNVTLLPKYLLKNVIDYMERLVFQKLIEWKDSTNSKLQILRTISRN